MAAVNGNTPSAVQKFDDFLKKYPSVKLVHIQYLDLSAIVRSRLVPVQSFRQTLKGDGVHPGSGSIAEGGFPSSNGILPELLEYLLPTAKIIPDINTIRFSYDSARLNNTATVIADIVPNAGLPKLDARGLLVETVAKAKEANNLTFLVGHELEFCFMERDRTTIPTDRQLGLHNSSITSRSRYWPVLNEIIVAFAEQDINVIEAHKEYDPNQFEIALPPLPPVESADLLVYARELIRDIAYRHELHVSFYPDPFPDNAHQLNGAHVHISATPTNNSSSFNPDEFLGGLLSHVPALCGIGMTSVDSYGRADANGIGVGARVAWGTNNRSTAIRLVTKNHWEVRCSDSSSNPYLLTAAIIAAGLDKKPLTYKEIDSKPLSINPHRPLSAY